MNIPRLFLSLLFSVFLAVPTYTVTPETTAPVALSPENATSSPTPSELSPQVIQDIHIIVLKIMDGIEGTLDSIGQSLASGASRLQPEQKATVQATLNDIRSQIELIKQLTAQHVDMQSLCVLASFVHITLRQLQTGIDNKLLSFPAPQEQELANYITRLQQNTLQELGRLLQESELALVTLNKDIEVIGLTRINKVYRGFRRVAKKYHLYDVAEHVIVYSAFTTWCAYITPEDTVAKLLKSNGRLDNIIGKLFNFLQENITGVRPYPTTHQVTSYEKTDDQRATKAADATHAITISTPSHSGGSPLGQVIENTTFKPEIKPIFDVPVASLFATYFTRDAKNLYKGWQEVRKHLDNKLYGTTKVEDFLESSIPKERFKDIVGREEIKEELGKIVEYIAHTDRYNRAGIKISRGYLLVGSPQTGKTFMARALAGEISDALQKTGKSQVVRFFEIGTDNIRKNGIHYYLDLAKEFAPCILFFDELDLARLQRDGDSGLLSAFLQCMSDTLSNDEKDQVFILGVTNKPSNLDFALLQPGRFGKVIYFEKPTFQHRIDYFTSECTKRCMNLSNFDFTTLAQLTEGCHFGALKQVIRTACMKAKMEGTAVTQAHFEDAIATEIHQIMIGAPELPAHKERLIAIHQAGKALASILLQPEQELCQVTVLPVTQPVEEKHVTQQYKFTPGDHTEQSDRLIRYGDIFAFHNHDSLNMASQKELLKLCKITIAGNAAQLVAGVDQCVDHSDRKRAFELCKKIVLAGIDTREMSRSVSDEQLTQAWSLLANAEKEVIELLTPYKDKLFVIADALQKHKTLSARQIKKLIA